MRERTQDGAGSAERPARKAGLFRLPAPQLATRVDRPPHGRGWLHEVKLDGYRILARIENGRAQLISRNGGDWTGRFPAIAAALANADAGDAVLDGEVVALERNGASSFRALQEALSANRTGSLTYLAFDLLFADGRDLTKTKLETRKHALSEWLAARGADDGLVRYVDHFAGNAAELLDEVCRLGLEGIVCKRRDAPYRSGRGTDWLKIKCVQQAELVVGGYTMPSKARPGFGALLLGGYDDKGRLEYTGRVGTGFSARQLQGLAARLRNLRTQQNPFDAGTAGLRVPGVHWVRPEVVVDVEFSEWTRDGILRHPVFRGVREDKRPEEILLARERAAAPQDVAGAVAGAATSRRPAATDRPAGARRRERVAQSSPAGGTVAGVTFTHADRVLYPAEGITKLQLASYYEEVAPWMLPQLARRPLMLVRCPGGLESPCFHQKHPLKGLSGAVRRVNVDVGGGTDMNLYVDSIEGVLALVQMNVLELHVWGCRVDRLDRPDLMIFDLDPGPGVTWTRLTSCARELAQRLSALGMPAFPRLTGGKGLHLVVPLARRHSWDEVKEFSGALAALEARERPDRFTANMAKARRRGRIFIDYLRNGRGATAIASYSSRARRGAPVAVPIAWDELDDMAGGDVYNVGNLRRRLRVLRRDPWEGFDDARVVITRKMRASIGAPKR